MVAALLAFHHDLPSHDQRTSQHRLYQACLLIALHIELTNIHDRYWGKRDTKLILPTNSSLSVTLDQDHLRSTTTSRADPSFTKDRLWLNGIEEEIKAGGRMATCISELKKLRKELVEDKDSSAPKVSQTSPPPSTRLSYRAPSCRRSPSTSPRSTTSPLPLALHPQRQVLQRSSPPSPLFTNSHPPHPNFP